ncbi:hypothetical protein Clacol_007959 [Clathrus columnatus]|uniref:Alpha/beta hydrolase fold-3 domain-containing protein n=1 Tax=Clathrus columnatus TaxID=1419009 RepID=A0AAV5AKT9_9AGAM|nr:hypothetical protein Clacol_007959 [Clathrus columnatus]
MAQYTNISVPDPEWAAISANLPERAPFVSIPAFRERVAALRAKINLTADKGATEGLTVIERKIEVVNGEIRVRAYIPDSQENEVGGFPLMVWMFGGGFVVGDIDDDDVFLRNTAVHSRIVCVQGDYRKAPEYPFPAAVDDSYAALKWALSNSSELSIDISKGFIVAGASAGGILAAVLAHRGLKDPEIKGKITGQILLIPTLISPFAYPEKFKSELLSLDKDEDKHMLTKRDFPRGYEAYHGDLHATNLEVSPLLAESFRGLPPAYIQIAGLDLLRDEAFLYERLLRDAGVPTKLDVYPGVPHGFYVVFKELTATKKQEKDFATGLDWLLGRSS